jgi:OOP family OmpA-OmpF porin
MRPRSLSQSLNLSLFLNLTLSLTLSLLLSLPALAQSAPPPSFAIENNALVLPGPVVFKTGTAELAPEATKALEHIAAFLAAKDYITTLRIEGHVSSDVKDGIELSKKRALAVTKWLKGKGVDCKRLLPVAFGDMKPVASNSDAEGRAKNTRIEAVNAALRGRAIGGMPIDGGGMIAGDPCN